MNERSELSNNVIILYTDVPSLYDTLVQIYCCYRVHGGMSQISKFKLTAGTRRTRVQGVIYLCVSVIMSCRSDHNATRRANGESDRERDRDRHK